jgi:hypothetical protein
MKETPIIMSRDHPKRIQRKRTKGWKMPPNTLCVTRPLPLGNPFRVGGWFAIGAMGMRYVEAMEGFQDQRFTLIDSRERSLEMFREYRRRFPLTAAEKEQIRNAEFIACWCPLDQTCHADILLEMVKAR